MSNQNKSIWIIPWVVNYNLICLLNLVCKDWPSQNKCVRTRWK